MRETWPEKEVNGQQRLWVRKGAENQYCNPVMFPYRRGRSRYHFETRAPKRWPEAKKQCRRFNSELVEISSRAEINFLWKMVDGKHSIVGLTQMKVGKKIEWRWLSGNRLNSGLWYPRQPSKSKGETRGELYKGLLNNIDDTEIKPFICECRML